MMVTGFLRVLVSGVLLLATTITTLVQPVGALSYSEGLSVACGVESSACQEDETCTSCSVVMEAGSAEFTSCFQAAAADDVGSSTVYCFGLEAEVCCLDAASENDCLANGPFVEYWGCALEAAGCWGDEITCDNGLVRKSSGGATATLGEPSTATA